jgi:Na+/melibiose symporter-like transporter
LFVSPLPPGQPPLISHRNNTIRNSLASLGYSPTTIRAILESPVEALSHQDEMRKEVIDAYRKGFRIIFLVGACLAAFAFLVAVVLMKQVTLDRKDDAALKEEAKRKIEEKERRKRGDVTPESTETVVEGKE